MYRDGRGLIDNDQIRVLVDDLDFLRWNRDLVPANRMDIYSRVLDLGPGCLFPDLTFTKNGSRSVFKNHSLYFFLFQQYKKKKLEFLLNILDILILLKLCSSNCFMLPYDFFIIGLRINCKTITERKLCLNVKDTFKKVKDPSLHFYK